MKHPVYYLVWIGNFLLAIWYTLGGLTVLFPGVSILPNNLGIVALGTLLLATGLFGSPYCTIDLEPYL
jgi:hypothetical protein